MSAFGSSLPPLERNSHLFSPLPTSDSTDSDLAFVYKLFPNLDWETRNEVGEDGSPKKILVTKSFSYNSLERIDIQSMLLPWKFKPYHSRDGGARFGIDPQDVRAIKLTIERKLPSLNHPVNCLLLKEYFQNGRKIRDLYYYILNARTEGVKEDFPLFRGTFRRINVQWDPKHPNDYVFNLGKEYGCALPDNGNIRSSTTTISVSAEELFGYFPDLIHLLK